MYMALCTDVVSMAAAGGEAGSCLLADVLAVILSAAFCAVYVMALRYWRSDRGKLPPAWLVLCLIGAVALVCWAEAVNPLEFDGGKAARPGPVSRIASLLLASGTVVATRQGTWFPLKWWESLFLGLLFYLPLRIATPLAVVLAAEWPGVLWRLVSIPVVWATMLWGVLAVLCAFDRSRLLQPEGIAAAVAGGPMEEIVDVAGAKEAAEHKGDVKSRAPPAV